jgi:hypothetical protein
MRAARLHFWRSPRRLVLTLGLFGLLASGPNLEPQEDELSIRAAYLFNLTKYVDWPPSLKRIIVVVVGDDSTAAAIRQLLNNKVTDGRPVQVVVHPSDTDLRSCDVVYLDQSARSAAQSVREKLNGMRCITVGDNDRFVREGGMVGLVRSGDQIQIFVNVDATQREGVVLSSRLLNLAVLVHSSQRSH